VDLSILFRGHNPLENTRATPHSVCYHHHHGLHLHGVLTHVMSVIITIIIIHPSHMAWARPTWSCIPIASPELHRLCHDHPNHITRNTITTIQFLDYTTSVPKCLIGVAITRHTKPYHWSTLKLSIKPTTHKPYNSAQGLQLGTRPTTRHESYNSSQGLQLGMKPTTWLKAYNST
jgi:hypothetical protein